MMSLSLDAYCTSTWMILNAINQVSDRPLTVPIFNNSILYMANDRFRMFSDGLTSILDSASVHLGRLSYKPGPPRGNPSAFYAVDAKEFGLPSKTFFLPAVDLGALDCGSEVVALGYIHLTEGVAKAIELMQASSASGAEPGPIGTWHQFRDKNGSLSERYFAAFLRYTRDLNNSPMSSFEDFCILADLAMMVDPTFLASRQFDLEPVEIGNLPMPLEYYNVFSMFEYLVDCYANNFDTMHHIRPGWQQVDANLLQEQILELIGCDLTLTQLSERARHYGLMMLSGFSGRVFLGRKLIPFLSEIVERMFEFRIDVLHGGPLVLDLLTSKDELLAFIDQTIAAFSIGPLVLSMGGFEPGRGVGVDMVALELSAHLMSRLMFGNSPCRLHTASPRRCDVKPWALCNGLALDLLDMERCFDGQLIRAFGPGGRPAGLKWIY